MSDVFIQLGQRLDEAGPPISGPAAYPEEGDGPAHCRRRADHRPLSRRPLGTVAAAASGAGRGRLPHPPPESVSAQGCWDWTDAEVTAVATFYSMYRRTPTGDYLVGVCTNTLCAIMGGDAILDALQDHLDIHAGETTADGRVTLEHIEVQCGMRLRPGGDGELGVLRQPDSVVGTGSGGRPTRRDTPGTDPRGTAVHLPGNGSHLGRPDQSACAGRRPRDGHPGRPARGPETRNVHS